MDLLIKKENLNMQQLNYSFKGILNGTFIVPFFCRKVFRNRQNFLIFTLGKNWKIHYNTKRKLRKEN